MPPTVFIVGASRGIGKGLVDVFHKAGWSVHATIRNTNVTFPSNVVTHLMDVENEDQIVNTDTIEEKTCDSKKVISNKLKFSEDTLIIFVSPHIPVETANEMPEAVAIARIDL